MTSQFDRRVAFVGLLVMGGLLALVAVLSAGSANPLDVYGSGSVPGIVLASLLLLGIGSTLLQFAVQSVVLRAVEKQAGMPAQNVICPGCGNPLVRFIGSHGLPILCRECGGMWHNGPACYNAGMPRGKILAATYSCPRCRAKKDDSDLYRSLSEVV